MSDGTRQEGFDRVVKALAGARSIVVMTGAGAVSYTHLRAHET